jgi:FkbM family methyltransferase
MPPSSPSGDEDAAALTEVPASLLRPGVRSALGSWLPPSIKLPVRARWGASREPELSFLGRFVRPGMVVADIGANQGMYTHALSRQVGKTGQVLAYEPQPQMYDYLRAGLSRRLYGNVVLSDLALSDATGTAQLTVPLIGGHEEAGRATLETGSAGSEFTVRTARLDDELAGRSVGFIKCDVEGHEGKVIDGATRLLEERRAVWLIELEHRHAGSGLARTLNAFLNTGHRPYYADESRQLIRVPVECQTPERINAVKPGRYVYNFFFVPDRLGRRDD